MDILTIIGLMGGVGAVVLGQVLEGGSVSSILQLTAAIIVFGGTFGAVLVNYPLSTVVMAFRLARRAFVNEDNNQRETIGRITDFAQVVRRDGLLALEPRIRGIKDPFLKRGVQLVVDGTGTKKIRDILEIRLVQEEGRKLQAVKVFESAGGYAPTIGILGAVLGLIHVMENLADPSRLGSGIAVAFVATVYGVGSANLLWLPLAGKLKVKIKNEAVARELMVEGIVSLAHGENPRLVKERLEGFLAGAGK
ncbi:MAG: flagellar motor protein [Deltaproteobacteria bacterium]|nr:flagellar motor protein [Deltaproteobacteria bacterium]